MTRVVSWFSCGAASAVATKLALREHPDAEIVRELLDGEHPDNDRFAADCERWFGHPITTIRSEKYASHWEVIERRRFLVGPKGALCTTELKKIPRFSFQLPDDVNIFGFTAEEQGRADQFRRQNFDLTLETPLITAGLRKADCLAMIRRAGIELPAMYRLGYRNNNCIGCVKGGAGYWNKIRVDFPEAFARMAALERTLGRTIIKLSGKRVYLDELPPDAGRHQEQPDIECSLLCVGAEGAGA